MADKSKEKGERLRVGVVGCGVIAATHIPYIRKAGGELVGIADMSLVNANDLADRFNVQRIYRTAEELIAAESPDVVHVLTPPHTHADVAIAALERGVHVLVEKPMALEVEDAERMVAAAGAAGRILTVDHNRLFDPVMLQARQLVESGAVGDVVAIESYQAGSASDRPWLAHLPGGGLGDLVPHPLYLQLAFLGPVREIQAVAFGTVPESGATPAELRVLMRGDDRSGVLTISTAARPQLNTLKICGTNLTLEANMNNMTLAKRREYNVPKIIGKPLPNLDEAWQLVSQTVRSTVDFVRGKVRYYPGMGNLIDGFYEAVRTGSEAPVTAEQGADVVRVTSAIWEAVARAADAGRDEAVTVAVDAVDENVSVDTEREMLASAEG